MSDVNLSKLTSRSYPWTSKGTVARRQATVDDNVREHALHHARFPDSEHRKLAYYHSRYYYFYSSNFIYSRYRISRIFVKKEKTGKTVSGSM